MGQLQNLEHQIIATALVKVSESGGFEVRGLSPYDFVALFMRRRGELTALFDSFAEKVRAGEAVDVGDGAAMIMSVLETAPDLVAEVISLAAGNDPQQDDWMAEVSVARKLAVGVQADTLQKIAELTFSEDMPAGKFISLAVGAVQNALAGLNQTMESPPA